MRRGNLLLAIMVLGGLSLSAGLASAQCSDPNGGGTHNMMVAPGNDGSDSPGVTSLGSLDLDLFTRLRMGVLVKFSWGIGSAARPRSSSSSFAVLRERRGLMR